VLKGQADMVELLAGKGADVNARNGEGSTPLADAALKGYTWRSRASAGSWRAGQREELRGGHAAA
jgi:hypothetical protein